jgi:uncharacterized membrane protein YccC
MAIRFSRDAPDRPHLPIIQRLDDHPEFAERASVCRVLREAKTKRQAQLDLMVVTAALQSDPIGPRRDRQIESTDRLRRLADMPVSIPEPAERDGMPAVLADALELLAGKPVEPAPDFEARKKLLRQELAVITGGLAVAEERLGETRQRLTDEVAESLRDYHRGQLRQIYETAAALAEAAQAERATVSSFLLAGYGDASAILLRPSLAAAGRLGSLEMPESEISIFRQRMRELGII